MLLPLGKGLAPSSASRRACGEGSEREVARRQVPAVPPAGTVQVGPPVAPHLTPPAEPDTPRRDAQARSEDGNQPCARSCEDGDGRGDPAETGTGEWLQDYRAVGTRTAEHPAAGLLLGRRPLSTAFAVLSVVFQTWPLGISSLPALPERYIKPPFSPLPVAELPAVACVKPAVPLPFGRACIAGQSGMTFRFPV